MLNWVRSWSFDRFGTHYRWHKSRALRGSPSGSAFRNPQSANSHLLEQEIGCSLFRRTPRGIELTKQGRTFLYEAECVVGDVPSLSDTARRLKGTPSDTLIIGMGSGMAQIFIPRLFCKSILPGVRLENPHGARHRTARVRRQRGRAGRVEGAFDAPARSVALSLFRRRQPLSRRKEGYLSAVREAIKTQSRHRKSDDGIDNRFLTPSRRGAHTDRD